MAKEGNNTPVYKKWWFWVIIVVVGLSVIFYIVTAVFLGSVAKTALDTASTFVNEVNEVNEGTTTEGTTTEADGKIYKVGDTVTLDGQEIVISKVERNYKPNSDYIKPGDGKEYVKIDLQIKNTSDEQIDYSAFYWNIEDGGGDISS